MEKCGGKVWWKSGTVWVELCGGTVLVEQCWWNTKVEELNSVVEQWNSVGGTVEQ